MNLIPLPFVTRRQRVSPRALLRGEVVGGIHLNENPPRLRSFRLRDAADKPLRGRDLLNLSLSAALVSTRRCGD